MTENPEELIRYGFFKGFNIYVAVIIVLQAMTGLVRFRLSIKISFLIL